MVAANGRRERIRKWAGERGHADSADAGSKWHAVACTRAASQLHGSVAAGPRDERTDFAIWPRSTDASDSSRSIRNSKYADRHRISQWSSGAARWTKPSARTHRSGQKCRTWRRLWSVIGRPDRRSRADAVERNDSRTDRSGLWFWARCRSVCRSSGRRNLGSVCRNARRVSRSQRAPRLREWPADAAVACSRCWASRNSRPVVNVWRDARRSRYEWSDKRADDSWRSDAPRCTEHQSASIESRPRPD